uniref:RNA ligase domain-containing protein n=1 Tax=viral metagenome TaxID=1070528 RepID=A0A6C0BEM9_9ZZZZ
MKLATFETIEDIKEIEGADNVVLATVLGWEVVIRKSDFLVGDRCVYIPVDTVVDLNRNHFKFLKKSHIRTEKIRGTYSQGLVLPLTDFVDVEGFSELGTDTEEDISELIGVSKYEKEDVTKNPQLKDITGKKGNNIEFPGFPTHIISKTDEDNLKTKKKVLNEMKGLEIYISQKQDGSSMTAIWISEIDSDGNPLNVFNLCSRNISLLKIVNGVTEYEYSSPMVTYAKSINLEKKFEGFNLALQGEFCGPGVNGNKLQFKAGDFHWYIFNVKDLETKTYYGLSDLSWFCSGENLEIVPILSTFVCDEIHDIFYFQIIADSVKYGKNKGEGIVIRPVIPKFSYIIGKNLSVKVINREYKD